VLVAVVHQLGRVRVVVGAVRGAVVLKCKRGCDANGRYVLVTITQMRTDFRRVSFVYAVDDEATHRDAHTGHAVTGLTVALGRGAKVLEAGVCRWCADETVCASRDAKATGGAS
jgi:hypothetical protein